MDKFDVPVTELVPDELVNRQRGVVELVGVDRAGDFCESQRRGGSRIQRSARLKLRDFDPRQRLGRVVQIHHDEARGVPDLVGEGARGRQPIVRQNQVAALHRQLREREAHRVGAVLVHDFERIDHVAARLGHLLAVLVAHQRRDVDVAERHRRRRGAVDDSSPNIIMRATQKKMMSKPVISRLVG